MKILIVEGTDNVGKDTLISNIIKCFPSVKVIHCEKPKSKDPQQAALEQTVGFIDLCSKTISDYMRQDVECLIHNRSWYGEYVYGCMYRGNDPSNVLSMISRIEDQMLASVPQEDICYVTLLSDSYEFLTRNDDGLSLSNADIGKIRTETERFIEVHEHSKLTNKHIVYVNDGLKFRPLDSILNEVRRYLGI